MPISHKLVTAIDEARRKGYSYDDVVAHLQSSELPDPEHVVKEYSKLKDKAGRRRDQVNLGDPGEPLHGQG